MEKILINAKQRPTPLGQRLAAKQILEELRGHLAHVLERHVHLHVRHRLKWSSLLIPVEDGSCAACFHEKQVADLEVA